MGHECVFSFSPFLKLAQWQNVDLAISFDAGSVAKTRELCCCDKNIFNLFIVSDSTLSDLKVA